jgi:hypothetical protein
VIRKLGENERLSADLIAERDVPPQPRRAEIWMIGGLLTLGHADVSMSTMQDSASRDAICLSAIGARLAACLLGKAGREDEAELVQWHAAGRGGLSAMSAPVFGLERCGRA